MRAVLVVCCSILLLFEYKFVLSKHVDKCNLFQSELGPDWYKVPRPIPTGFEKDPDYQRSYIHMPCAATTVFDVATCGCTNLMSFLFSSVSRTGYRHDGHGHEQLKSISLKPLDIVKEIETTTVPTRQLGIRLLNTKTGEVRHCPFRSSSQGPEWYLVHEHTDVWRPMKCAPGTMFQKRSCTCIHSQLMLSGEADKQENGDIVVLEDGYMKDDKTISKSLGIKVADVDFRKKKTDNTVPFWRRKSDIALGTSRLNSQAGKSAVMVTLNGDFAKFDINNNIDMHKRMKKTNTMKTFNLGRDKIADEHKLMLRKLRKGPISRMMTENANSPLHLDIDSMKSGKFSGKKNGRLDSGHHLEPTKTVSESLIISRSSTRDAKPKREQIKPNIRELNRAIEFLGKHKRTGAPALPVKDEIYFESRECPKKPLPEMGAQYFEFYVWGVGYIPYTCHGNLVYDHDVCACIPAPKESTVNELNIPVQECTKKALPDLGPSYFRVHVWGLGTVPYACYGNRMFSQELCACVPKG